LVVCRFTNERVPGEPPDRLFEQPALLSLEGTPHFRTTVYQK